MNSVKTIALTGCTRGLGLGLLKAFSKAGHTVFGGSRSEQSVSQIQAKALPGCHLSVVDVGDEQSVERWSRHILAQGRVPDLVINNAGIINSPNTLWQVSESEFQSVINVNIVGVHRVVRHLLPAMLEQQQGVIVNLSSGWGRSIASEVAPYCASKWAIEGLTKALAEELPSGMSAVPLSPGVVDTDMLRQAWGDGAGAYQGVDDWASKAAPFILQLSAKDNGQSLTTP